MLENYTDNLAFPCKNLIYYPTYSSLSDKELRGYFTWRTQLRNGNPPNISLTYLLIYVYELINNIGVGDPQEGFDKLLELSEIYAEGITSRSVPFQKWLRDYIIYYNLPGDLISREEENEVLDENLVIFDNFENESKADVLDAIKKIAPSWLNRSRFYARHAGDVDEVIYLVLVKMNEHYSKKCKNSLSEQFFKDDFSEYYFPFSGAVFGDPLYRTDYEYELNPGNKFGCKDGYWYRSYRRLNRRGIRKLDKLFKTIDCRMREFTDFPAKIKSEVTTKWIRSLIDEVIRDYYSLKSAREKNSYKVDLSRLDGIRADANMIQEKLNIPEEAEEEAQEIKPVAPEHSLLSPSEYRLLHSLLYGGDLDWLKKEGIILSVLVDSLNEKLYESFEDMVIEDGPQIVEDYRNSLMEICPE